MYSLIQPQIHSPNSTLREQQLATPTILLAFLYPEKSPRYRALVFLFVQVITTREPAVPGRQVGSVFAMTCRGATPVGVPHNVIFSPSLHKWEPRGSRPTLIDLSRSTLNCQAEMDALAPGDLTSTIQRICRSVEFQFWCRSEDGMDGSSNSI